jgi:hypothetical protein
VSADPVGQLLALVGLCVCVIAGAQYADKDLGLPDLTGFRVDDGDCLPSIVDKGFLATFVGKAHRRVEGRRPVAVEGTELAVPVAVWMGFAVLDPQQAQSDALLA